MIKIELIISRNTQNSAKMVQNFVDEENKTFLLNLLIEDLSPVRSLAIRIQS